MSPMRFVRQWFGILPLPAPLTGDIAMAVVYLGSDESRWVTGIDMVIDAGMLAVKGDHQGTTQAMIKMWEKHDAKAGRA